MTPCTFNPLFPDGFLCPNRILSIFFLHFLRMFINGKEQKVGLSQSSCQPALFTPMEYLSVPSILGSISIVELHIDFHFQQDRMTILKVCVCVVGLHAPLLPCDSISRASAVPSGSMQADTAPDVKQCKRKLNYTHEPRLVRPNIVCCGFCRLRTVISCSTGYPMLYDVTGRRDKAKPREESLLYHLFPD